MNASPAFGPRRLHTNTDFFDCPNCFLSYFLLRPGPHWPGLSRTGLSRTGLSGKKDWPERDLAKVDRARTRNCGHGRDALMCF